MLLRPVTAILAFLVLLPFKNLQVLRPDTDADLYGAMSFMAGSLGVTCEHCHVNPWDSDERDAKKTARQMMRMVREINETYFDGRPVVTCAACHHGSLKPAARPDLSWAG